MILIHLSIVIYIVEVDWILYINLFHWVMAKFLFFPHYKERDMKSPWPCQSHSCEMHVPTYGCMRIDHQNGNRVSIFPCKWFRRMAFCARYVSKNTENIVHTSLFISLQSKDAEFNSYYNNMISACLYLISYSLFLLWRRVKHMSLLNLNRPRYNSHNGVRVHLTTACAGDNLWFLKDKQEKKRGR